VTFGRAVPALVALGIVAAQAVGAFDGFDDRIRDGLLRSADLAPRDDAVVVIGIDDATLAANPAPLLLWEGSHAAVVDRLVAARVRAIGIDLVLASRPGAFLADWAEELSPALVRARAAGVPVVLVASQAGSGEGATFQQPDPLWAASSRVALANLTVDPDGVVRRQESPCEGTQPLAWVLADALGRPAPTCTTTPIRWRAGRTPRVGYSSVATASPSALAGAVALIGFEAPSVQDHHRTPLTGLEDRLTPGVEIHAHLLHTLLSDDAPRSVPGAALLLCLGLAFGSALLGRDLRPSHGALGSGALALLAVGAARAGLGAGLWLPVVGPLLAASLPGIAAALGRLSRERAHRQQLSSTLGAYVNEHVLSAVLADPEAAGIRGARRTVTVLMADIAGYSSFSEHREPEEVVEVLNEYFGAMTEVIQDAGGTVDKFIGDGLMAIFGAPLQLPGDGAAPAVDAALDMEAALLGLQERWAARGIPRLDIGIGIHTGEAVVGNLGSHRKMEYTVIGDAVNVAARIESATRSLGRRILISEETLSRIASPPAADDLGPVTVKGREQPVRLFGLGGAVG